MTAYKKIKTHNNKFAQKLIPIYYAKVTFVRL